METITDNKEEATTLLAEYEGSAVEQRDSRNGCTSGESSDSEIEIKDDQMRESSRENPCGDFLNAENERFPVSYSSDTSHESIAPTEVQAAPRPQNQLAEYFVPENKESVNENRDFRTASVERKSSDTEFELKTQKQVSEKPCVSKNEQSCETLPEQLPNTGATLVGIDASQNLFNPRHPDITRQEQTRVIDVVGRAMDRFLGFLIVPLIVVFGIVFYLVDVDSDTTPAVDHFQKDVTEPRDSEDDLTSEADYIREDRIDDRSITVRTELADYVHENRIDDRPITVRTELADYVHENRIDDRPITVRTELADYVHENRIDDRPITVMTELADYVHKDRIEYRPITVRTELADYVHENRIDDRPITVMTKLADYVHEDRIDDRPITVVKEHFQTRQINPFVVHVDRPDVETNYFREDRTYAEYIREDSIDEERIEPVSHHPITAVKADSYITLKNKNDTSENGNLLNGVTPMKSKSRESKLELKIQKQKSETACISRDEQSHEPLPEKQYNTGTGIAGIDENQNLLNRRHLDVPRQNQHTVKSFIRKAGDRFFGILDILIIIVFGIVLYLVDVGSDIMAAVNHFKEGNPVWGSLTITFVVLPTLCWAAVSWTLWHVHDPPDNQQGRRRIRMVLAVLLLDPLVR